MPAACQDDVSNDCLFVSYLLYCVEVLVCVLFFFLLLFIFNVIQKNRFHGWNLLSSLFVICLFKVILFLYLIYLFDRVLVFMF